MLNIICTHVPREGNQVADALAKNELGLPCFTTQWWNDLPLFLSTFLLEIVLIFRILGLLICNSSTYMHIKLCANYKKKLLQKYIKIKGKKEEIKLNRKNVYNSIAILLICYTGEWHIICVRSLCILYINLTNFKDIWIVIFLIKE